MRSLFFAVLIVGVSAAPSLALPSINLYQTGTATGRLDVVVTGSGSIAAEITLVDFGNVSLTNVTVNSAIFDTANPGDSPFIAGSPEGGDSLGLTFEPELGRVFASFGSSVVAGPGTYNFLTFQYSTSSALPIGFSGFTADGFVAQAGVLTDMPAVTSGVIIEAPYGDFDGNGAIGNGDLTLLLANWGKTVPPVPAGWIGIGPTAPNIGNDELMALLGGWGQGTPRSVAMPEPATALMVGFSIVIGMLRQSGRKGS